MDYPSPDLVPGDGDIRQNWRQINEARNGGRILERHRRRADETIFERRRPALGGFGMFPFKVYLAILALGEGAMLKAFPDTTTWWRIFLVRCGEVAGVPLSGNGCDGWDIDPDSDYLPQDVLNDSGGACVPIVVPAGTTNFFLWINTATGAPLLKTGLNADIMADWPSFPSADGSHYLISIVNTDEPYAAYVRQYQRTDIIPAASSAVTKMTVVSESTNTITCTPPTGANVTVAKPPALRGATAVRTVTTSGVADKQEIGIPGIANSGYAAGQVIFVATPTGGSGVAGATLQDLNVDGRVWLTQFKTCEPGLGSAFRVFACSPPYTATL
jgi:hypothetical protein